jgi:hypothetical protein
MPPGAAICGFDLCAHPRTQAVIAAALGHAKPSPSALTAAEGLGIWPLVIASSGPILGPSLGPSDASSLTDKWRRHCATIATLRAVRRALIPTLAGLRWLVLKGDLMSDALFGSPWSRSSSDVDLLVDPADLSACLARLIAQGFTPTHPFAPHGNNQLALRHPHLPLCVEVHWALEIPAWPQPSPAWLLDRATPSAAEGAQPDPLSLGLITTLHFAHHQGALKPLLDLAAWWDRFGTSHGPDLFALTQSLGLLRLTSWATATLQTLSSLPCPGFPPPRLTHPCARALAALTSHLTRRCLLSPPNSLPRVLLMMVKPEDHRWQTALLVASQLALSSCLDHPSQRARAFTRLILLGPHSLGRRLSRYLHPPNL